MFLNGAELCGRLIDVTLMSVFIWVSGKSIPFELEPMLISYFAFK